MAISSFDKETGCLAVRLLGQCSGCLAASDTMGNLVRKTILEAVPEVREVVLDDRIPQDMVDFARELLSRKK